MIIEEVTATSVINRGFWVMDYETDEGGRFVNVAWFKRRKDAEWYVKNQ